MSFKEKTARFFMGRNGADQLYMFLMICCLALVTANIFAKSPVLYAIELLLVGWTIFRFMSKNIYKRQAENRAFLGIVSKIKDFFNLQKRKFTDRKTHVYRTCPSCKKHLRLPKKKGEHNVCCPCCKNNFSVKI